MADTFHLETERLVLRSWRGQDLEPFAEICADEEVMRFFPSTLPRTRSAGLIENSKACFRDHGYFYAPIVVRESGEFIGFAGLDHQGQDQRHPFAPGVDIGWRLKRSARGEGLCK